MRTGAARTAGRRLAAGIVMAAALSGCGGQAVAEGTADAGAAAATPVPTTVTTPRAASAAPVAGYVTGSWQYVGRSTKPPTAGHSFVNDIAFATNDPRVNGGATFDAGEAFGGLTGYTWATMTITNDGGTWSGPCKGATWGSESTVIVSCELNGTGEYAGNGFFVQMRGGENLPLTVEGVIYRGDIPEA